MINEVFERGGQPRPHEVLLVGERDAPVRCAKGMIVTPHTTTALVGSSTCS